MDRAMGGGGWLSWAKGGIRGRRRFKGEHRCQGIECCECGGRWEKGECAGVDC